MVAHTEDEQLHICSPVLTISGLLSSTFVLLKLFCFAFCTSQLYVIAMWRDGKVFPLISIREVGGELLKMMKHGNSWYFNWVIKGFMHSILSYIRADVRLRQAIESLSISF